MARKDSLAGEKSAPGEKSVNRAPDFPSGATWGKTTLSPSSAQRVRHRLHGQGGAESFLLCLRVFSAFLNNEIHLELVSSITM